MTTSKPQACPHGNMPREAGAGHWRDWHRGHGCHLDPDKLENRPVDHAVATRPCSGCGAPIGTSCRVEIHGRLHDGAHRERLLARTEGQHDPQCGPP